MIEVDPRIGDGKGLSESHESGLHGGLIGLRIGGIAGRGSLRRSIVDYTTPTGSPAAGWALNFPLA